MVQQDGNVSYYCKTSDEKKLQMKAYTNSVQPVVQDYTNNKMTEQINTEEDKSSTMCGFSKWKPKWMQWFANINCFVPFISIFCLMQG